MDTRDVSSPYPGRVENRGGEKWNSVCRPIGQFLLQVTSLARHIKPRRKDE
jgi:hypothetical protein